MKSIRWAVCLMFVQASGTALAVVGSFSTGEDQALHRGVYEVSLNPNPINGNPFFDVRARVTFTRPDGSSATADAFYDGENVWRVRAYCDQVGKWRWRSDSGTESLNGLKGQFQVVPSKLPGKLRKHPDDPFQFARDDGSWFLHIGDTGYRYVVATEPHWREYIDQAAEAGFTKVRTWFAQARSAVMALYSKDRTELALEYWREIDRRLRYALERHPGIVFQLIPYAEDTKELKRYASGDPMARLIGQAAQARWSAFPNVYWSISNDREIVEKGPLAGRKILRETIDLIGRDFSKREPWGTLMTNHQARFTGYAFVDMPWSDVITLEDLNRVDGKLFQEYREIGSDPIVNDEDRYELYRDADNKRYYFRRLMWASLLSGGHATYGGLRTYEAWDGGPARGVRGYFDACRDGTLNQGAHDFRHIHGFFRESGLTLVGMKPNDALVGGNPLRTKCARNDKTILVYLANPSGSEPETDSPAAKPPQVEIRLLTGPWRVRWFNPRMGEWSEGKRISGDSLQTFTAPAAPGTLAGDRVLLLNKRRRP